MYTKYQRRAIYNRYKNGGSLCCKDGLRFLRSILSEHQALELNEWAYNELSCKENLGGFVWSLHETKLLKRLADID